MAEENKHIVLKCYKRAVEKVFETDKYGKREIDKLLNIAKGQSKKNLKELKAAYDKNPEQILKEPWIPQLSRLFYSHDLLRDIIAIMIEVEHEVVKDERTQESDA